MVVPTTFALNPRDFRLLKTKRFFAGRKRGILDGSLLWKFVSLDVRTQDELAGAMGVSADVILDNLLDIDVACSFF
jgi:hypothetical protein